MMTPEQYEAEIDRLGQALDLEAKMRKTAADIANERGGLIDEFSALLNEVYHSLPPLVKDDARSLLMRSGWWR